MVNNSDRIANLIDWDVTKSRIIGYFHPRVHNQHDLEDLTQEVLFESLKKLGSFETTESAVDAINDQFCRFAIGIAKFKFREFCRKRSHRSARIEEMGERGCEELAAQTILPQYQIDTEKIAVALHGAMKTLPPALRQIAAFCLCGLSTEEIADRLSIETAAIHERMSRLRARIRSHFESAGIGISEMERILFSITYSTEWANEFAAIEIKPWANDSRFSWREFVRYTHSRPSISNSVAETLNKARRQAERIDGDRSDMNYIIDQIGSITMELQRDKPNAALLRKYVNRIRQASPITADILDPICGGEPKKTNDT